jgi:hypothetical protein
MDSWEGGRYRVHFKMHEPKIMESAVSKVGKSESQKYPTRTTMNK